jgi:serine/threonine protein kinase
MSPTTYPKATARRAGDEPIPGYALIEPLGRGGFGEVWKCEAPGGLHKAVKFVPAGGDQFRQEAAAFERIKSVRHAFLLTLERVELVGGDLVMVMELADCQLQDRLDACRRGGLAGVPRDELLGYLADAAEALDVIGAKYALQHLDVKPANLFLLDGHVKVGDYGLVRSLGGDQGAAGMTPKYAAPEVLRGWADARSDQYSLALVYHELLTGGFPFAGRTPQQLMMQHVGSEPDLSALPPADRAAVGRALAKAPADRFPTCVAFIRALSGPTAGSAVEAPRSGVVPVPPAVGTAAAETLNRGTLITPQLPRLVTVRQVAAVPPPPPPPPRPVTVSPPAPPEPPRPARLPHVSRVPALRPRPTREGDLTSAEFVAAVVAAATPAPAAAPADGSQVVRFLSTIPTAIVPHKLVMVAEPFGLSVEKSDTGAAVLRRKAPPPVVRGVPSISPGGLRVDVRRDDSGEVIVSAGVYGAPDDAFRREAVLIIPDVLARVRRELENVHERRAHPRFPAGFPVRVHPVLADGTVVAAEDGHCEDVSAGGVRFVTRAALPVSRVYLEFRTIEGVAGNAVLAGVLRSTPTPGGHLTVCRFRT